MTDEERDALMWAADFIEEELSDPEFANDWDKWDESGRTEAERVIAVIRSFVACSVVGTMGQSEPFEIVVDSTSKLDSALLVIDEHPCAVVEVLDETRMRVVKLDWRYL